MLYPGRYPVIDASCEPASVLVFSIGRMALPVQFFNASQVQLAVFLLEEAPSVQQSSSNMA